MPAGISDGDYYVRRLELALSNNVGKPLLTPVVNDFSIVSDDRYFGDIAERVKAAYDIDPNTPTFPGMEPDPIDPAELARKQRAAVAIARAREGVGAVMQVIVTTFNEDSSRALYRYQRRGQLIQVLPDDEPDTLYVRVGDYIDDLFAAAALARVVPSPKTRASGEAQLREGFALRRDIPVLPLATLTGRNNARLRNVWLEQLERTTKGYRHLPKAAKDELLKYIESRPDAFKSSPDMHAVLANLHPRNTGRHKKSA